MADRPKGRLGRLARLGNLTGRVTTSYVRQRVRDVFTDDEARSRAMRRLMVRNAEQVADNLSALKGAAMKVGQGLAVAANSLDLPAEVSDALSKLHREAEPIPFATIREDVEVELERPLEQAFSTFEPHPLGTASLGQAHAATLPDGTDVVVKVLHRGIEASVDTDLMALKTLLVSGRVLRRNRSEIDNAFTEIRARLREELDYLQEAANIAIFHDLVGDDERIRVPRVHPGWSTERVLTMDRLPGMPLEIFLKTADPEARQRAGLTLGDLYFRMAMRLRTLHADPHPGNYLFEPDGRVGLLDFGCVKRFDEFWMANYARAGLAAMDGDREAALEACRDLGAWNGEREAGDLLWQLLDIIADPFRQGEYTLGGHRDSIMERLRPVLRQFPLHPEIQVPRDLIYLHRSLVGLYAIARQLVVRADWGAILRSHAEHAIARAEGRLPA